MAPDMFVASARAATAEMRSVFPATPLLRSDLLSQRFGADIWLKREDLSPVRSYKLRGAFNAMRKVIGSHSRCLCLRQRGQPCAGRGLYVSAFWGKGRGVHACHNTRAEGDENPDVWRRKCRDPSGG